MTTAADLVATAQRYLYSGHRDQQNKLASSINTSETSLTFTYDVNTLQSGCYISINLEIMYVWTASGTSATVERAQLGTTAASHTSGDIVYVNALFPKFNVFEAINDELHSLSSPDNGLYQVDQVEFTWLAAQQGYDLTGETGEVLGPLEARVDTPGPYNDWPRFQLWDIHRNQNTTDFPSGYSVQFKEGATPGYTVRVQYAKPFTVFTALTDDLTTTGLPATAEDIPSIGAALRLQAVREPQRNFNTSQGDSRRAEEVPPGANFRAAAGLQLLYERRIREEARRLKRLYPKYRKVR